MYINKMVFIEADEVQELISKYGSTVVVETDYGTTEIVSDSLQCLMDDLTEDDKCPKEEKEFNFTKGELMEDLNNSLGTDVTKMLLEGELDFVQVVY